MRLSSTWRLNQITKILTLYGTLNQSRRPKRPHPPTYGLLLHRDGGRQELRLPLLLHRNAGRLMLIVSLVNIGLGLLLILAPASAIAVFVLAIVLIIVVVIINGS